MANYLPSSFIDHLRGSVPGFDQEIKQFEVAKMLWMFTNPNRRHLKYENSINISSDEIVKIFGRSPTFKEINRDSFRYFYVHRFLNGKDAQGRSYNNGYEPMPWMTKALVDYLSVKPSISGLLDDGKEIKTPPKAIAGKTKNNHTARGWGGIELSSLVKINAVNLAEIKSRYSISLKNPELSNLGKCSYRFLQSSSLLQMAKSSQFPETLIHRYTQSQSGRLYAEGLNLQNCPKEIRNAALAGLWDYDINCCHFAILEQMAGKLGFDCPVIRNYVENKKVIREQIANDVGITIADAKVVLTATIYGARMSLNSGNAISNAIGKEAANLLFNHDTYIKLRNEIERAKKYILKNYSHKNGRYINHFGMAISIKDNKKGSILSHLMEGVEAAALRSAVSFCNDDIVLLQHDGFVTQRPINLVELENRVHQDTGYILRYDQKQIVFPSQKNFVDFEVDDTKSKIDEILNENNGLELTFSGYLQTMAPDVWCIPPVYPSTWDIETPF